MRIFALLYNSFIWGLIAAILAFQNVWLKMRMNIGYIIPVVMILSVITVTILKRHEKLTFEFSLANMILSSILAVLVLGGKRLELYLHHC